MPAIEHWSCELEERAYIFISFFSCITEAFDSQWWIGYFVQNGQQKFRLIVD
jgi:hypothetical protein